MPSHSDEDDMTAASPEKPIRVVLETEPPARKPGRPRLDISAHFQDTGEMANHSHRFVWCIGCIKSGRPLYKRDRLPARGDLMQRHLQTCRYVSDEVRQKFRTSPRSSSASSAGDSKARKARIANIISESGSLRGSGVSGGVPMSTPTTGPRLPPITSSSGGSGGNSSGSSSGIGIGIGVGVGRSKLTTVVSRSGIGSTSTVTASLPATVPMPMPISTPLRPPYSLSRPATGGENQLPRIRSPQMRSATPIDLPSISRRSHPYLNRENHQSSASLRGSQTPGTPVMSPSLARTPPLPQHYYAQQQQQRNQPQQLPPPPLPLHPLYRDRSSSHGTSPVHHHIRQSSHSSPASVGSSIGMSEPMAATGGIRATPPSSNSASNPGTRYGEIRTPGGSNELQTPLTSTATISPVNNLRGKLQSGSATFGIVLNIPSPVTARLASRLGYDWACIDLEHSAHSASIMAEMVAAINSSGACAPLVRVPSHSSEWIKWAVDAGAQGIIIPGVKSREQMKHLVSVCSSASASSQKYRHSSPEGHMQQDGRHYYHSSHPQPHYGESAASTGGYADVIVIPQIDRPEAIDNIEDILSVPGVDAAFVRPQALPRGSLGVQTSDGPVGRALQAGRHYAVPIGIDSVDGSSGARACVRQGFQMVAVANDIDALASAAADQLRLARMSL
ncbi:hypothetical protein GGI15_000050 [Coemansia interrupta]|uniref:HpcH/HpaI aldolase/citrate lyase domain-containing protein n=1 Tax=Coemansia interrupta TaxID=1126814 RepID=A0A9W8HSU1_9FUNG|nr:hypothetical protein GGI15_000050 [Coemansia interrupta]